MRHAGQNFVSRFMPHERLGCLIGDRDVLLNGRDQGRCAAMHPAADLALPLFFGFRLQWTDSMIGNTMLTLFWVVGVTNAFNLADNMDGLCAGTALVAGTFVLIGIVDESHVTPVAHYLAALLGATAGFLTYNIHPASIFMGDAGSLFLGLNLAAITLIANPRDMASPACCR
jgi:UDP-GlcNAc:undecaprenyl-phosphate GlcNAc-1-phosphate transferase